MRNPKRLVLAVPVAPSDSLSELRRADDIVCLQDHLMFGAIGFDYRDFRQISDEEVIEILQTVRQEKTIAKLTGGLAVRTGAFTAFAAYRSLISPAVRARLLRALLFGNGRGA